MYKGEVQFGRRHGKGEIYNAFKDSYIGEFYNNSKHGFGILKNK